KMTSNDAPGSVFRTFSMTWLFVTTYPRAESITNPDPLDWAVPLGRRLITVTTVGRSSFTTPTTSPDPPTGTLTDGALGIGPVCDDAGGGAVTSVDGAWRIEAT